MVGGKKPSFPIEPHSWEMAPGLVQAIWGIAEQLKYPAFDSKTFGPRVQDDHLSLNQSGIPAIDIIDFKYPHWHRLSDLPENCSGDSLEQVAQGSEHVVANGEIAAASPPRSLVVGWPQIIFGAILVLVLLFVAILYSVRQVVSPCAGCAMPRRCPLRSRTIYAARGDGVS